MIKGLCFILFFLLSACSNLAPPPSKPLERSWTEREQALKQMNSWKLKGAIAIRTPQESGSVSLSWRQQNAQNYHISLFGPLGSNAVEIDGKPGIVTLQTSQGKQISASSAEQLLYNQLGWKLPISHLYYWARGLPVPGLPAKQAFDAYHRLSTLSQENWQLSFNQYGVFDSKELPTRIVMTHPQLRLKIVIYQWGI